MKLVGAIVYLDVTLISLTSALFSSFTHSWFNSEQYSVWPATISSSAPPAYYGFVLLCGISFGSSFHFFYCFSKTMNRFTSVLTIVGWLVSSFMFLTAVIPTSPKVASASVSLNVLESNLHLAVAIGFFGCAIIWMSLVCYIQQFPKTSVCTGFASLVLIVFYVVAEETKDEAWIWKYLWVAICHRISSVSLVNTWSTPRLKYLHGTKKKKEVTLWTLNDKLIVC